MDLKRVALGYHSGSTETANRFIKEALKRKSEIGIQKEKPYIYKNLAKLARILAQKDKEKLAEDALMYSTIFQNYAIHK